MLRTNLSPSNYFKYQQNETDMTKQRDADLGRIYVEVRKEEYVEVYIL